MSYSSDLSAEQWSLVAPFFERANPRGARPGHERQRMVEAILYRLREGCRWRALPHDFPGWTRWPVTPGSSASAACGKRLS